MKVTTKIYLAQDSHGNRASATCEDSCDSVQLCGLKDTSGKSLYFESDAYHVPKFCEDNCIELKIIEREENFDDLWSM